jgi:hypothetical protein
MMLELIQALFAGQHDAAMNIAGVFDQPPSACEMGAVRFRAA